MAKGIREKIKLASTAGTGHFYTTTKNKRNSSGKMEMSKYDPLPQARDLQRNQTEVIRQGFRKPRRKSRFFIA